MKVEIIIAGLFLLCVGQCSPTSGAQNADSTAQYACFTKQFEGFKGTPYVDADGHSIGYGFNLNRSDALAKLSYVGAVRFAETSSEHRNQGVLSLVRDGVTKDQARTLLEIDIVSTVRQVKRLFPSFDSYPRNVRLILIDLHYNLGSTRFRKFEKFSACVEARDWLGASVALTDSQWYWQTGRRGANHVKMLREL